MSLKKSPWSKLMLLSQRSYLKIVLETTSAKSSSSHWFQFSMPPEASVHSATQTCLSRRFLFKRFTCTPPLPYARVCAHARVHTATGKERKKRAVLAVEKMLGIVRTQPIQPENYGLTYESWILKVLIHLRMEILASPDLHIETYMTSFSDRLFFFLSLSP